MRVGDDWLIGNVFLLTTTLQQPCSKKQEFEDLRKYLSSPRLSTLESATRGRPAASMSPSDFVPRTRNAVLCRLRQDEKLHSREVFQERGKGLREELELTTHAPTHGFNNLLAICLDLVVRFKNLRRLPWQFNLLLMLGLGLVWRRRPATSENDQSSESARVAVGRTP